MVEWYSYEVFGLQILSELELPELFPTAPPASADVKIVLGPAITGGEPGLLSVPGGAMLTVKDVAEYVVLNGSRIIVSPIPGTPRRNIRLYLLGSVFGLLVHQRGYVPLHANAIDLGGKSVAFMGQSGAGKSTLAAWFHDQGYSILTDDVSVVRLDNEAPAMIAPGLPRFRLWRDAIDRSGRQSSNYSRSYSGDVSYDKFDVPVDRDRASREPVQLGAIYLLASANEFEVTQMSGVQSVEALFENTYRGAFIERVGDPKRHWETCVILAASVPIFLACRKWDQSSFDQQAEQIRRHAEAAARTQC